MQSNSRTSSSQASSSSDRVVGVNCEAADALAIVRTQVGELAGHAVGATVLLNVLFAGYARGREIEMGPCSEF